MTLFYIAALATLALAGYFGDGWVVIVAMVAAGWLWTVCFDAAEERRWRQWLRLQQLRHKDGDEDD